jgi:alpha/beta hydrolase family protein
LIASLAKISWFAPYGMGFAERFVNRSLAQVTRYFTNDAIRSAALESVSKLMGPETKVLIGHSLGSVVAYEAAHVLHRPLSLLVNLGCPLGLQSVIYQRLRPQPPGFPPKVRRGVNVADRDDFIAAEPDLKGLFSARIPVDAVFEGGHTAHNGAEPHNAGFAWLPTGSVTQFLTTLSRRGPSMRRVCSSLGARPFCLNRAH